MQVELKVLGGLPVTIEYTVEGPDESVGLYGYVIDDWSIVAVAGRKCKTEPKWLYKRIDYSADKVQAIRDECLADFMERLRELRELD